MNVKMKQAGVDWLDGLARENGCTRSDVLRAATAVAANHEKEVARLLKAQQ